MAETEGGNETVIEPKASPPSKSSPAKSSGSSPKNAASPPDAATGILPAEHWAQIEADDNDADADSAVGSNASSSTSVASSILQYRTIQGRTFHSDQGNAQYWGSNDEAQNEALDIMHHVLTLLLDGKLYLSPLKNIQNAIDIGTGTGIWAIDFADEFPDAEVIGTDVSPIQPSWVPPNVQFQIDDCTQDWTFQEDSSDYIHLRWLLGSVADWTGFMKQAFKTLKPGGYLQSHEGSVTMTSDDNTVHDQSAIGQWGRFFIEGGRKLGRSFTLIEDGIIKDAMEAAGFVDIEVKNFKCPVGGWPRDPKLAEIGEYMRLAFDQDSEGAVLFMANLQGWTREEILVYTAHLRREMHQNRFHPYFRSQVVYGRKPEAS